MVRLLHRGKWGVQMNDPAWLQKAIDHLGTAETPGRDNNPAIMQFYKDCGHKGIEFEDTAWCAAFVGACLKRSGKPVPQPVELNLMARSYLKYGVRRKRSLRKGPMLACRP